MNLWLRYPMWKAIQFLHMTASDRRKVEMAHVLRIGPIALAVIWQEDEAPSGEVTK